MLNYFSHTSSLNLQIRGGIFVRTARSVAPLDVDAATSYEPRKILPSKANESFSVKRSGIVPRTVVEGSLTLNETHRH